MKIQCDVCDNDEASVFCVADEAALCATCDHRVHQANKLAGKHERFSLHQPSPNQSPLCDICQERRAFLFCQQDRAILCTACDESIHKANEYTLKHTRFFLTGVKFSSTPVLNSDTIPSMKTNTTTTAEKSTKGQSSSISEYLIETLPGWHVEDFLDFPSHYNKNVGYDGLPIWDAGFDAKMSETVGLYGVPKTVTNSLNQSYKSGDFISFGAPYEFNEQFKDLDTNKIRDDNSFAVPQISPHSAAFNGSMSMWVGTNYYNTSPHVD